MTGSEFIREVSEELTEIRADVTKTSEVSEKERERQRTSDMTGGLN